MQIEMSRDDIRFLRANKVIWEEAEAVISEANRTGKWATSAASKPDWLAEATRREKELTIAQEINASLAGDLDTECARSRSAEKSVQILDNELRCWQIAFGAAVGVIMGLTAMVVMR